MFAAIKNVFPMRPLRINYAGTSNWNSVFTTVVLGCLLLVSTLYFLTPGIVNDYKVSQSHLMSKPLYIDVPREFSCRRNFGFIVICYGDFKFEANGQRLGRYHVDLWLDFFRKDPYTASAVMIRGEPETVTLGVAVEKIWNRLLVYIGLILIAVAMFYSAWRLARQAIRGDKMTSYKNILLPIIITLDKKAKRRGSHIYEVSFIHPESGKNGKANLTMRPGERVFMLDELQKQALGIIPKGGTLPVLMDDNLLRIDFDDDERAAIFAAIGREKPDPF